MTQKRIACPSCRSVGGDATGNHLKLYDRGDAGYCRKEAKTIFLKDWAEGVQESKPRMRNSYDTLDLARVSQLPIKAYPERKISLEAMEHFGVRSSTNENDGSSAEHFYPYFDEYGKISGYKRRVLPKQRFDSVEGSKIKGFFGQNKAVGDNFVILVEGELDCLSAFDTMRSLRPDRAPYNVVSMPHGADENGILDQTTKKGLEWLGKFKKVILMLDMDAPGRATALAIADYLVSHTEVLIAELPLKDTADMWEAGRSKEWGEAINKAKKYVSDQIVLGTDTPLEELLTPIIRGFNFSFLPRTSKKLNGFRPGELTTIIAPPNVGKSSLVREMMYELLVSTDENVFGFFLEEMTKKTKQSVIAYHCGMALNDFRENPHKADKHKVQEAYDSLLPRLHLFEHRSKVLTDDLIERKIEYMVKALGCKKGVLDHLSYVIGGRSSTNERKDVDMLMTRLSRSVEDWQYHLFLVSHIKRGAKEQQKNPEKVKYPFWEFLDMSDARSSGAIEQLSHNMIAMERQVVDPAEDNTRGLIRTRVLRSREWGATGMGDVLTWSDSGRFTPIEL